jgi:hypothetical protein
MSHLVNKEPPQSKLGRALNRKIPDDFERETLEDIRKAKKQARRELSPVAGALMPANTREINKNFSIRPESRQVCKKHRNMPLEYFNPISCEYICKICATSQQQDKLIGVLDAARDIQEDLNTLKSQYLKKRTHVIDRLTDHMGETEAYFQIFYDALDERRRTILKQEYEMRDTMNALEKEMKDLLHKSTRVSMVEMHMEAE